VDVLLWLVPTGVATVLAMLWAAWTGHRQRVEASDDRRRSVADDEAARAKLGAALAKPLPRRAGHVARQRPDHVSGVAVRRQQAQTPAGGGRGPGR
jgi:hypothetical protein